MLLGEHRCVLDEKSRLNFPARFREDMGESFVVTCWLENCLIAFPDSGWNRFYRMLTEGGITKSRMVQRQILAGASPVAPDKQGRILIAPNLREHAGLEKDIVVLGLGTHAEIWDVEAWEKARKQVDNTTMAAVLEDMGI